MECVSCTPDKQASAKLCGVSLFTKAGKPRVNYGPDERRQMLDAPEQEFRAFVALFAPRRSPFIIRKDGGCWTTVHHPLTDDRIVQHLLASRIPGKTPIWVGTCAWDTTKFVAIDVDYRGDPTDFVGRCNKCEEALYVMGIPSTHWLVRPSPSGGRHYFFFFKRPVFVHQLADVFRMAGLNLKPGGFEIYPSETQNFRLPFGHHPNGHHDHNAWRKFIRDYESGRFPRVNWERCFDRATSHAMRSQRQESHIPSASGEQTIAQNPFGQIHNSGQATKSGIPKKYRVGTYVERLLRDQTPKSAVREGINVRRLVSQVKHHHSQSFEAAWASGINSAGVRLTLTIQLAWHLVFVRRLGESEVVSQLVDWVYRTGRHTSKDVEKDLRCGTRKVERQTQQIVNWLIRRRVGSLYAGRKRFTDSDIAWIVRAVRRLPTELQTVRLRFVLDFLNFAKSTGTSSADGWVCFPSVEGVIKKWPNCGSSNFYKAHLDWVIEAELVKMIREKAQSAGRARTYLVLTPPSSDAPTQSFQEALDTAQVLLGQQVEGRSDTAAGHQDDYRKFVSRGGRENEGQTKESDRQLEFGKGGCKEELSISRCSINSSNTQYARPTSTHNDGLLRDATADTTGRSFQPSGHDPVQQGHQPSASAGAGLEQSSRECSRSRPAVQGLRSSVVGQEHSVVREAAAIEKLIGSRRCSLSHHQYKGHTLRRLATGPP